MREAGAAPSRIYHLNRNNSVSSSSHIPSSTGNFWRCTHTRENQVEIQKVYRSLIAREKRIFAEQAARACEHGLCPNRHRPHAWNRRKRKSMRHGPWGPRKESASTMADSSAILLEWSLARAYARCASVVTTGPNMKYILPSGERAKTLQLAKVSPSGGASSAISVSSPTMENHCLFRALWSESWEDADTWLWQQAAEISDGGPRGDVPPGRLTGTHEHMLE